MFSGGDETVVARWLENFARSHAKREDARAEAEVETEPAAGGPRFAVRIRVGRRAAPAPGDPPLALPFDEVAAQRGSLAWCARLAGLIRELVRDASGVSSGTRQSA
jgi:hypothetical protein